MPDWAITYAAADPAGPAPTTMASNFSPSSVTAFLPVRSAVAKPLDSSDETLESSAGSWPKPCRLPTMTAADYLPSTPRPSLQELSTAAHGCQGCDLYKHATQTVFGEGATRAEVMLVGEQPGDREDLEGEPFVGPAGRLLDQALERAGIDRRKVYVTNAVKHFKWEARGKRRLHKKPSSREVAACRPWLAAEISAVRPEVVVCLGATAAQSLLGPSF